MWPRYWFCNRERRCAAIQPRFRQDPSSHAGGCVELEGGTRTAPASPVALIGGEIQGLPHERALDEDAAAARWHSRWLTKYSEALEKRPVVTKSISSGIAGLLGDLTTQTVEWGFGDAPIPWSTPHAVWRSCAAMVDGFCINGPLLHYCYEILENIMPAGESVLAAVLQVVVDVFVIDPVFAFIFVWSTGLMERKSIKDEIFHTLQYEYPTMVLWLIVIGLCWAPLQIYLFNRYPVQFRVLASDFIDLVWTCVTSFYSHT